MSGFTLRGVTVLDRGGGFTGPVDVRVVDGLIAELDVGLSLDIGLRDVDLAGLWLLPGVFDVHLHALTHSHDPAQESLT
ncbi:MAG: amidohydrolase [Actinomycetia bacterium]|nr:amidohydrolase [Actinomycetes bacterium]